MKLSDKSIGASAALCVYALFAIDTNAAAPAASYPSKPIRWILPYAPGGATDIIARIVGQKLTELMGQQIIIDNRGGGASVIGTEMVARAAPDGYTMLLGTFGFAFTPALHQDLPYDTIRDFAPVSILGNGVLALVVNPTVPLHSVKELIAAAKAKPNQIIYGSTGGGSSSSLGAMLFKSMTGTQMTEITYKGAGPSTLALLSNEVSLVFSSILPVLPHIKGGRLNVLGVSSPKRSSVLPNVPTIAEAGVPGYELVSWYGILLPSGTPQPIIATLYKNAERATQSKDVGEKLALQGIEPATSTPAELAKYIRTETTKWSKLMKDSGAT